MVRNEKINCIVVKDFSRFARNYIELGSYLEQIFPFMGIRFISINDNYDSKNYQENTAQMDIYFKNLLYDLYSKDLSQKVCSSLAVKKEEGQYVSANSPFGYEKDSQDKHSLVIAQEEAEIVKEIYSLTIKGYTSVEIARLLNERKVKTPIEFKIEKGRTKRVPKGEQFLWSSSTICQILKNQVYIGNVVQKKYKKDSVGGKICLNPCEDWVITYNHHAPIISEEIFYKVQKAQKRKRTAKYNKKHYLVGKLVCGCCKKNLSYRRGKKPYYTCCQHYVNAKENCIEKVNVEVLEQIILLHIQEKLQEEGELERLYKEEAVKLEEEIRELQKRKQLVLLHIQKCKSKYFKVYQDYACEKESKDKFKMEEKLKNKLKLIEKELRSLREEEKEIETIYYQMENKKNKIREGKLFMSLSKEIIDNYINKILIFREEKIEIDWNCCREKTFKKFCY